MKKIITSTIWFHQPKFWLTTIAALEKKKNETLNLVDTSLLGIYQAHVPKQEFEYIQVGQQKRQIYQHQIKQFIPQSS